MRESSRIFEGRSKVWRWCMVAIVSLSFSGCWCVYNGLDIEPDPDFDNPIAHVSDGIAFEYPGNWTQTTEVEPDLTTVSLESMGDIVIMMMTLKSTSIIEPHPFMVEYIASLQTELDDMSKGLLKGEGKAGDAELERTILGEKARGAEGRFTMRLLGESEKMSVMVYTLTAKELSVVFLVQAPDNDMEIARVVLTQVLESMRWAE